MTISIGIDQRLARWFWLLLGAVPLLCLAEESDPDEAPFELSPFEVSTSADDRYLSTNATSGTSLNIALKDLPMAIQVVNQDFLTDIAAANLDEGLAYAAGVFTDNNAAPWALGATRGIPGGGRDTSVSSAGRGTPFANLVYIRGLSVPYQNRMGFRYGGIVKTPYSNIALGGLLDSANIERIEIVRGPNAVLYGTGVLSGIVNVIPERPLAEPRTEISIRAGNDDYLRTQAEITGPLKIDWLPGLLTYRATASTDSRGHWTDFREEKTRYWTAQLEYQPAKWMKVFLEYQDGFNRDEGTGPQWIYDFPARDKEFRNEFDEFYNWARHNGAIEGLMPVDPDGFKRDVQVIYRHGSGQQTHPGMTLLEEPFIGGGKPDSFRISGPDTFNERNERNLLADLELYPLKGLTINLGTFQADQETKSLSLSFNAANTGNPNEFLNLTIPRDKQAQAIWESGHVYGAMTRDAVLDRFIRSYRADPNVNEGSIIFPWQQDEIKLIEYWWVDSIIKARTEQYRLRATYTFEAPFLFGPAHHTLLAGFSYIEDNVDFPDGGTNVSNARANRPLEFKGALIDLKDSTAGRSLIRLTMTACTTGPSTTLIPSILTGATMAWTGTTWFVPVMCSSITLSGRKGTTVSTRDGFSMRR
jgi:outer membrane receptor protein involved in Fe transport